jgi:hypothetical protein
MQTLKQYAECIGRAMKGRLHKKKKKATKGSVRGAMQ